MPCFIGWDINHRIEHYILAVEGSGALCGNINRSWNGRLFRVPLGCSATERVNSPPGATNAGVFRKIFDSLPGA